MILRKYHRISYEAYCIINNTQSYEMKHYIINIRVKCEVQTIRGSNVLVGILYRQQQREAWPYIKA